MKNNDHIFGGIHVIGAGSFYQLPPVPSVTDPALYAFQSQTFSLTFPHKVSLQKVVHQDQMDLICAVHELCMGTPLRQTSHLMKSLSQQISITDYTVHIFGTHFDVDMYNHDRLHQLQGDMLFLRSEDKGNKRCIKLCKVPRCLALKQNCKVIITHNLANGLVNGLCGKVVNLNSRKIQIEVGSDDNLLHGMDGQVFTLEPIYFDVCDVTVTLLQLDINFL